MDNNMIDLKKFEVWFLTGSQHLYGGEILAKVAEHSKEIAAGLKALRSDVRIVTIITPICLPRGQAR